MNDYLMKGFFFSLNLVSSLMYLSIFILQYYDLERLIKIEFNRRKKYIISFILLFLLFHFSNKKVVLYLMGGIDLAFVLSIKGLKLKITRRSILLILSLMTLSLIEILFIKTNVVALFFPFLPLLNLFIAALFTYPFEKIIDSYYIFKAKSKIRKYDPYIIGITGSYGKTTTRNLIYSLLKHKYQVITPKKNINTFKGILKFINEENLNENQIIILELGIDKKGQMKRFKKIFSLSLAIVTNIGPMHLATLKNIDSIKKEKMEIVSLLKNKNNIILNGDSSYLQNEKGIFYSSKDIKIIDENHFIFQNNVYKYKYFTPFIFPYFHLLFILGEKFFLPLNIIKRTILEFEGVENRFNITKIDSKIIIKDCYNNNLEGVKEDINFIKNHYKNRIIITSGIIEVGNKFEEYNSSLGILLKEEKIIFIGNKNHPLAKQIKNLILVKDIKEAYRKANNEKYDCLLILSKGEDIYLK